MAGRASGVHPIPAQGQEVELYLERWAFGKESTLGTLYVPGGPYIEILEDYARPGREPKVPGRTAIPAGVYQLGLRTEGGFHERYGERFSGMHQGMIEVLAVPRFKWILLHCGNDHEDTEGCLLTGHRGIMGSDYEFYVQHSEDAYRLAYPRILQLIKRGPVRLRVGRRAD